MTYNTKAVIITLITLAAFTGLQAQARKKVGPHWNWETHQVQTIAYAKKYPVSGIEANVPHVAFADWFQQIVGRGARVDWEVNDCGEQTGTSADRGRDFPMCVEARTVKPGFFYISVDIQFGTFKRGVTKMKPVVRSITAGDEFGGEWLDNLSDLPKAMTAHEKAPQHLDPNGGFFTPSEKPSDAFKDVNALMVQTMKNDRDNYVWMPPLGEIEAGSSLFEFESVLIDGTNWIFETKKLDRVSYKFDGKFAKPRFDADGKMLYDKVLSGHLTKLVNGKALAETDMTFDYVTRPCKGCDQPAIFIRQGTIQYSCPPCPPHLFCKPCSGNKIELSGDHTGWDMKKMNDQIFLAFVKEKLKNNLLRGTYAINVRVTRSKNRTGTDFDFALISFEPIVKP